MKNLLVLALFLIGFTLTAQDATGATISVTIENVASDSGTILAGLHTPDTFMKGQGINNAMAPAKTGEVILTFENVQPGTYALMIMHDANDNKQMDTENGMPKESFVTSGEMNLYGPPTFDGAKFDVNGEDQEFKLRF